ncbi:hypothetical protein NBRC116587_36690 [Pseudoteredinibacter isoporae]
MLIVLTVGHQRPAVIEWLDPPRHTVDFELRSEHKVFTQRSLLGQWTIVLFGFLHCPDVCPTALSEMADVSQRLQAAGFGKNINYVFVSVDPGRDSLEDISRYAEYFDPSILGLTGSEEQLLRFSKPLGIRFKVTPDEDNYRVAHSLTFSLIDPEGRLRGRFRPGFNPSDFVEEFTHR